MESETQYLVAAVQVTEPSLVFDQENKVNFELIARKNLITKLNDKWEKFKKGGNDYEMIFTTTRINYSQASVSLINPVSRAYFKHWEILHDQKNCIQYENKPKMKCAFLAEGPGGFLQAMFDLRSKNDPSGDDYFGITLLSREKSVPYWKLPEYVMHAPNVKLLTGVDDTGSLYNPQNVKSFISDIGANSCDYVTGDGGFDFSDDFNKQEINCLRLLVAEAYLAMELLKPQGCALIKMFNIVMPNSKRFLQILSESFENIRICKPRTSRPANSEKYIFCSCFKENKYKDLLWDIILRPQVLPLPSNTVSLVDDQLFFQKVSKINTLMMLDQIEQIDKTILMIKENKLGDVGYQTKVARQWCIKYGIPYK
jgi:23S rRNA U2552 (ribose-2'-O)-methylase RlmE/FtsJ